MKIYSLFYFCSFVFFLTNCIQSTKNYEKEARKIHAEFLSVDTHTDTPFQLIDSAYNFSVRHDLEKGEGRVDLPRMKEGELDAVFLAVFIGQGARTPEGNANAIKESFDLFDAINRTANTNKDLAELAFTPDDAYRIKKTGKRSLFIGIENGYAIGSDLSLIKKYYDMGARYITLCHTKNNDICTSSTDTTHQKGLTAFGVKVVEEMNRVGMMIDVSHISDTALLEVLKITKSPVIASHSCAKAVCNNPRNLSDALLLKIKENGGVVQVCILSDYVKKFPPNPIRDSALKAYRKQFPPFPEMTKAQRKVYWAGRTEIDKKYPPNLATVADAVDHIDHIVKVIGIDYVGIGTDFDGGGGLSDCKDASQLVNITIELLNRGYTKTDIEKIWGGNFMRVFKQVQQNAGR